MSLGVVASGHRLVSEAAASALRDGGNAFDAAVAAGFAAAVAEPMFTSLGGGGFLLARTRDDREVLFDFFVDTPGRGLDPEAGLEPHFLPMTVHFPASDQVFNIGLGSVAVPGTLSGLLHVHRRLGGLALAGVVAPAVALARGGVELTPHQAYVQELLTPIITLSDAGRAIYAPGGRALTVGDRLHNHDLADFLEELGSGGGRDLYAGELAARVAKDMREGRGLLSEEDLCAYRVVEREPLAVGYRGHRLLTNPPPSSGGSLVARLLSLIESHDPGTHAWGSEAWLRILASAMREVEGQRAAAGTTHVSVADREGNAVALSLSNGEGSGYVVPGTGIMLNNMLGEDDLHPDGFHASAPGGRVPSMMAPSLLLRDGRVRLILGSGGSKRIRTALLQVLCAVVDHGMDVTRAVEAPRIHWDGEVLQAEPGLDPAALEGLRAEFPLNTWPERNLYFGGVHAVDTDGRGAGDPRRDGHAMIVD